MSVRLVIDSLDFVQNAGIRHGKIPMVELVRLHDLLFDQEGELTYRISGQFDKNTKPGLQLEAKGRIHLKCQRCLGELNYTIDLKTFLLLAKNETELHLADEDDTIDAILAIPDLDVVNLIEDEVILSLPISSRHADGECSTVKLKLAEDNLIGNKKSAHPFAVLATLKKTN
ncbi:YceD family protein [Nitrosomonas supralitoralis]|uniref:Large ribosomal RNA subunit accumulation protein YceD n=1 Tax=Nitrosomonas supralitoralis TaxID=2116706 RepID=A0A2P7NSY7_9PROT|nr:YceD family protein [Nitrosomonas supralitoralis]PSJ16576.1 hypothetical protein C7H79_12770 [Nitrosomonas supralitoralis]